jgi:succinate dehydrogenase / fumarate reductase flavoprotein subunit
VATPPSSSARRKRTPLLLNNPGTENPFKLWRELGETMTKHATIIRYNAGLDEADAKIVELLDRYKNVNLSDKSQWANTSFAFTRQLYNMLQLGRVIVQGARLRDESRGAHYKPDFPDRNDEKFLKTTKASTEDVSLIKPRPRRAHRKRNSFA